MADRKELEQKIIELAAVAYRKKIEDLTPDSKFQDLSSSSLLMAGLVSLIEDDYDVVMSMPEAGACKTISELTDLVASRMK